MLEVRLAGLKGWRRAMLAMCCDVPERFGGLEAAMYVVRGRSAWLMQPSSELPCKSEIQEVTRPLGSVF